MVTKVSIKSNGDTWTFEVGKTATFVDRAGKTQRGDFTVTAIRFDPRLVVETDLRGISRFDWAREIHWAGEYKVLDESAG